MIRLVAEGVFIKDGLEIINEKESMSSKEVLRRNTITYDILSGHNTSGNDDQLAIRFDAMASHDITYVGIIQTAKASGMKTFPIPYVLTNCHNSLCAVGGTINEDDHIFGLAAAKKYGGIYVPAHHAVIHQYMREEMAVCGGMILGSDSHTRYGALGTMAIGEGGPELVKQLMKRTYDIAYPEVVAVYLEGKPRKGIGPQDVALSIIKSVFESGFVKNKVLEFVGPGIENLTIDFRNGIDVMTTETTCLSSIWCTDEKVKDFYNMVGRPDDYKHLKPRGTAYYDGMVHVDLSQVEAMIALPFHPSHVYTIAEVKANAKAIFSEIDSKFKKENPHLNFELGLSKKVTSQGVRVDQGIIAGCAGGTYENIAKAASILTTAKKVPGFISTSVYPASEAIHYELVKNGSTGKLIEAGIPMKTAFCGPCFGAGDVPSHQALSVRHTTRNFPNREGSKPSDGQIASVALMDAQSIAATVVSGGLLTAATDIDFEDVDVAYSFNPSINKNKVYNGFGNPDSSVELVYGPNITDWPQISPLADHVLLKMASVIHDDVTTTDELIPSGDTSSYRSNPLKLAEFTLSRKDPAYVERAKAVQALENNRRDLVSGKTDVLDDDLRDLVTKAMGVESKADILNTLSTLSVGSVIFANKPGDGSAREQAASCQRVLGALGNIAGDYATKRYRSNVINWGMLPFTTESKDFQVDDILLIKDIKKMVLQGHEKVEVLLFRGREQHNLTLKLENLSREERKVILEGCLMNFYASELSE